MQQVLGMPAHAVLLFSALRELRSGDGRATREFGDLVSPLELKTSKRLCR
jgi:hypothetical protein